ncbi:DUF4249 domain-containing protein [Antarcticibacterium flavum]|uniref:DUF4249 domain-containing protein n=1 Tax=Antarcticibacterium flavum TaxID=2058175 RepID=A0A5B7X6Y3_9FLAO|nr:MULTISPECIES: DUF4249 domain-containing protein [Antarcticibacterium]MCM4161095.1 DUF4249 domain-containing protein [Antarcticibacterium sp. W02-3]QCY70478.1 DUF4249 domain-containing protein [Antarcticibacterium flavum]
MRRIVIFCIALFSLYGCEEVVDVDLEQSDPRLVIEASILTVKDIPTSPQYIRLSLTTAYFDDEIPAATGANVVIEEENSILYSFEEIDPGIYVNDNFIPETGKSYTLQVVYEDEVYRATETFIPVVDIDFVEQDNTGGFGGEDIELKAFYTDPPEPGNYYLFRFMHEEISLQIYDDEFTNGNQTFAFFSNEDLSPGDIVNFEIQGISRRFYEYMFILRSQAGVGGGPFETQPTTVRGNVVNTTNPENFPFGYFRLSETARLRYTVE